MDQPEHRATISPTERRNEQTHDLDLLSTLELLQKLHSEDQVAVEAVGQVLPALAEVIDAAVERFERGGTVHYFGAGTSGRLGVLDASELLPTFNLESGRVVPHIVGGERALMHAVENAEDSEPDGRLAAAALGPDDVAIGIGASGSTPYVGGALEQAREQGAYTVLISSNPDAPLAQLADVHLALDTGPEALTGSTRMKAGTAQKLVLNAFSTALMIADGRTFGNLMVSVVATNAKLRERTVRILREATGIDEAAARERLEATGGDLKVAIVAELASVPVQLAREAVEASSGSVRGALQALVTPDEGES